VPTCQREMLGNTIYFLTYERMKDLLKEKRIAGRELSEMEIYGYSGAIAGFMYWAGSYPVDTVKSVMQADELNVHKRKYPGGIFNCIKQLYAENGLARFYRGVTPCLIRAMPVNAVQFITFEKGIQFFKMHHEQKFT